MDKKPLPLHSFELTEGSLLQQQPHLTLAPSAEGFVSLRQQVQDWAAYRYLVVEMLVEMDSQAPVEVLFEKANPRPDEKPGSAQYEMIPTRRIRMAIDFEMLASKYFFLLTLPGMLKGRVHCEPSHISQMKTVTLRFHPGYSKNFSQVTIYDSYLCNQLPDLRVQGAPMVDPLGQWEQACWSSKTKDEKELVDYLRGQLREVPAQGGYPAGWSRWGGWMGKRFDATGFFHPHHDGRRWWLADPDGYAFISNGMCYGSRMGVHGFTDGMENLFSWLPNHDDPTYKDAWITADQIAEFVKRNGAEAGKNRWMFNYARANMIRAFGPQGWWDAWVTLNSARLKQWGFNTIGVGVNNYPDERVLDYLEKAQIPFVWTLKAFPLTDELIYRDFPDVYSEQYARRSQKFAQQLLPFVGNPYMIGYFVTNEPEWRFQESVNLVERVFAHPARLASKEALIGLLREKYQTIAAMNQVWGSDYAAFDDLLTPAEGLNRRWAGAAQDIEWLRCRLLAKYTAVPHQALTAVDPNHLDLGMRYNKITQREIPGSESFQVASFNCYYPSPRDMLDIAGNAIDMPMVIGEWHIGGSDKGLLCNGLLAADTQEERGQACCYFLEQAVSHPACVGLHYFEMNDQPLLGRFDGECMQHGIIDICNRPYDEMVRWFKATAQRLYPLALGEIQPEIQPVKVYRQR